MTIWITSGDRPSNSRRALQVAGGFRKFNPLKAKALDRTINWGCSELPGIPGHLINVCPAVRRAANKLQSFQRFSDHQFGIIESVVPWTTDPEVAKDWLKKHHVVARTKLTGHSGEGIVILEPNETVIPAAPLYTRYINKISEFRVHVVGSNVIDVQRKIRDPNREPTTWKVRSHANGFIFARNGVTLSAGISGLAVCAIAALGLDFGAVDIIVDKTGKAYLLEVNTAPGLEGQTIESYATALKALCNGSNS